MTDHWCENCQIFQIVEATPEEAAEAERLAKEPQSLTWFDPEGSGVRVTFTQVEVGSTHWSQTQVEGEDQEGYQRCLALIVGWANRSGFTISI